MIAQIKQLKVIERKNKRNTKELVKLTTFELLSYNIIYPNRLDFEKNSRYKKQ